MTEKKNGCDAIMPFTHALMPVSRLAHYVVGKCYEDGEPVQNLQLHKMLYAMQLAYCAEQEHQKLLFPEPFEAWPFGPIQPAVYSEYRNWGGYKIKEVYKTEPPIDEKAKDFIDAGIEILRKKSPYDLACITVSGNSPWKQIYKNGEGHRKEIPNKLIIEASRLGKNPEDKNATGDRLSGAAVCEAFKEATKRVEEDFPNTLELLAND